MEKQIFYEDSKEKKIIARSAFAKNHHGGRVRLPSDNMTKKEITKMNGEVKAYRMNEPMKWQEYKALPDDLKIAYIKSLREKYGVPDAHIAKMMEVNRTSLVRQIGALGIGVGKDAHKKPWDCKGFYEWAGMKERQESTEQTEPEPMNEPIEEATEKFIAEVVAEEPKSCGSVPTSGHLNFTDNADKALELVKAILEDQKVKISVVWEVIA